MLIFSLFMENSLFHGSVVAWAMMILPIVLIIVLNKKHGLEILTVFKSLTGEIMVYQLRKLISLYNRYNQAAECKTMINGYLERHRQVCKRIDCPVKYASKRSIIIQKKIISIAKKKLKKFDAQQKLFLEFVYRIYLLCINEYPRCVKLRIGFGIFLVEKLEMLEVALRQFSRAESLKPPLDEQFIIYRYKKIIQDEIDNSLSDKKGYENTLDFVKKAQFNKKLKQLKRLQEKSTQIHLEFWSQLQEPNPDLVKLNDTGGKINSSMTQIEKTWNELSKINDKQPNAQYLYGRFLTIILQDDEKGHILLEKALTLSIDKSTNKQKEQMLGGKESIKTEKPVIIIDCDSKLLGTIRQVNVSYAKIFGYSPSLLTGLNLKTIQPNMIKHIHDSILNNYIQGDLRVLSDGENLFLVGKHRSGYVIPFWQEQKEIPSSEGLRAMGIIDPHKTFKNTTYMLTDIYGTFQGISKECMSLLRIDLDYIEQRPKYFSKAFSEVWDFLFPFEERKTFKKEFKLRYKMPGDNEYSQQIIRDKSPYINLNIRIQPLYARRFQKTLGYVFIMDEDVPKVVLNKQRSKPKLQFQWRYDSKSDFDEKNGRERVCARGELTSDGVDCLSSLMLDNLDQSMFTARVVEWETESQIKNKLLKERAEREKKKKDKQVQSFTDKFNLLTRRLHNGRIQDLDAFEESGEDEFSYEEESLFFRDDDTYGDTGNEKMVNKFQELQRKKKQIYEVLSDKNTSQSTINLQITANVLFLILLIVAGVEFFITDQEFQLVRNNVGIIQLQEDRVANMQIVLQMLTDLVIMNKGIYGPHDQQIEDRARTIMRKTILELREIQETILIDDSNLNENLIKQRTEKIIPMYIQSSGEISTEKFSLVEAVYRILNIGLAITNLPLESINMENDKVFFVVYNLFNDFRTELSFSADYNIENMIFRMNQKNKTFTFLLSVSMFSLILGMLITFPQYKKVRYNQFQVLSLFLEMPEYKMKELHNSCEMYLTNLQQDDVEVEEDAQVGANNASILQSTIYQDFNEYGTVSQVKRRKSMKNVDLFNRFQWKFFFGCVVVEGYFIFNYLNSGVQFQSMQSLMLEMNSTSMSKGWFARSFNMLRWMIIDNDLPMGGNKSVDVISEQIRSLYDHNVFMHWQHSKNIQIHDKSYKSAFDRIMLYNPCLVIIDKSESAKIENCENFMERVVTKGMTIALIRHFENMKRMELFYRHYLKNPDEDFIFPDNIEEQDMLYVNMTNNKTVDNILNILNYPIAGHINYFQQEYCQPSIVYLQDAFQIAFANLYYTNMSSRLALYIGYNLGLIAVYLFIWKPLISGLNHDIWRTKQLLRLMPLSEMAKIRDVRHYLQRILEQANRNVNN